MAQTTAFETLQDAAAATGNGAVLGVLGFGSVEFEVTGTFVGTITFEHTADAAASPTYAALECINVATSAAASTTTATGVFRANVAGSASVRARVSAFTSGTITVKARAIDLPGRP